MLAAPQSHGRYDKEVDLYTHLDIIWHRDEPAYQPLSGLVLSSFGSAEGEVSFHPPGPSSEYSEDV